MRIPHFLKGPSTHDSRTWTTVGRLHWASIWSQDWGSITKQYQCGRGVSSFEEGAKNINTDSVGWGLKLWNPVSGHQEGKQYGGRKKLKVDRYIGWLIY